MQPASTRILTINGGSSSIKFALFDGERLAAPCSRRERSSELDCRDASLRVKSANAADDVSRSVAAPNHKAAVGALMDWIEQHNGSDALAAVGHRVVHGGPKYSEPQRITHGNGRGTAPAQSIRS